MAKNLLKVTFHVLEGLQQAEHLRMLNVYGLQSTNTGELTVRELEADLGIPKTTVSKILMPDLGIKCILAKFVLWLLLSEQKDQRAAVANDFIQTTTNESDFLKKVITLKALRCHCSMYNVSVFCIFFNKYPYFHITLMDTFWTGLGIEL